MIEAGKGPPNASAESAVIGLPVDSQLRVHNNGFEEMMQIPSTI